MHPSVCVACLFVCCLLLFCLLLLLFVCCCCCLFVVVDVLLGGGGGGFVRHKLENLLFEMQIVSVFFRFTDE